jgi:hypothetical protein
MLCVPIIIEAGEGDDSAVFGVIQVMNKRGEVDRCVCVCVLYVSCL